MNKKNPFYILGLHPDLVSALTPEELKEAVESQRKILLKKYHPDKKLQDSEKKKSEEKFHKVNEACNEMEHHPELWEIYRRQYAKAASYKKQAEESEQRLGLAQKQSAVLYRALCSYFTGRWAEQPTIFNCYPCSIPMHDLALAIGLSPQVHRNKNNFFYALELDEAGNVSKSRAGKVQAYPNKTLIGTISEVRALRYGSITSLLRKAQRIWTSEDAIMAQLMSPRSRPDPADAEEYNPEIPLEAFVAIAGLLSPTIKKDDYLFSLNRRRNGADLKSDDYYFSLEGKVMGEIKKI